MSSTLNTSIVSIYDMMVERHIRLRRELEEKEAVKAANTMTRRIKEDRSVAEVNKPPIKSKSIKIYTRECESPRPANAITAAHLTKKPTSLLVQPPSEKEVIKRLVEKIAKGRVRTQPELSDRKSSKTKLVLSSRRRKMAAQQTLSGKQKLAKPNSSRIKRMPLSPRKEEFVPNVEPPRTKTPKMKASKTSEKKTRLQMQSSKLDTSRKATESHTNRWRV
ncbi:uncharacterized protein LOC108138769 [Drosophila elegans]|uniref:uncharacterized protein LOC108138769 n=1 Tax=Drosophila elegans TaxID=30023 RepID=UPI001BC8431F|nr:uncharacterized protein LOC108138769 [Drosophila elegans]